MEVKIGPTQGRNLLIVPLPPPGKVVLKVSGFNAVFLSLTGQEGSQEAVFTPLLKNQSIVTPKFLGMSLKSMFP